MGAAICWRGGSSPISILKSRGGNVARGKGISILDHVNSASRSSYVSTTTEESVAEAFARHSVTGYKIKMIIPCIYSSVRVIPTYLLRTDEDPDVFGVVKNPASSQANEAEFASALPIPISEIVATQQMTSVGIAHKPGEMKANPDFSSKRNYSLQILSKCPDEAEQIHQALGKVDPRWTETAYLEFETALQLHDELSHLSYVGQPKWMHHFGLLSIRDIQAHFGLAASMQPTQFSLMKYCIDTYMQKQNELGRVRSTAAVSFFKPEQDSNDAQKANAHHQTVKPK